MRSIVFVVLFLPSLCFAEEVDRWKWTNTDTAVQIGVVSLMIVDWGQTLDMSSRRQEYYTSPNSGRTVKLMTPHPAYREVNPILGDHPSRRSINAYFISVVLGHTVVARLMPNPYRRFWQALWIGGEAAAVGHNFGIGARVEF